MLPRRWPRFGHSRRRADGLDLGKTGEEEVPTLVLAEALAELSWRPEPRILDLGPAVTANVEILGTVPAQVHVADVTPRMSENPSARSKGQGQRWEEALPTGRSFDLFLTWDLFNYLEPEEITRLGAAMVQRARPGALLCSWISIRDPLPPHPARHELVDRRTVRRSYPASALTAVQRAAGAPSPRYREPQLLRWLQRFEVRKAFLMRHGVQEYLFRLLPPSALTPGDSTASGNP